MSQEQTKKPWRKEFPVGCWVGKVPVTESALAQDLRILVQVVGHYEDKRGGWLIVTSPGQGVNLMRVCPSWDTGDRFERVDIQLDMDVGGTL